MANPVFRQLNDGWNADPNSPDAKVLVRGSRLQLGFLLNYYIHEFDEDEAGFLTFENCSAWRLGGTNDHGWYAGQCRYSRVAPIWGEFYELIGEDSQRRPDLEWHSRPGIGERHYLFYLRDSTFECFAEAWRFDRARHVQEVFTEVVGREHG